jgi:hypothetical protein
MVLCQDLQGHQITFQSMQMQHMEQQDVFLFLHVIQQEIFLHFSQTIFLQSVSISWRREMVSHLLYHMEEGDQRRKEFQVDGKIVKRRSRSVDFERKLGHILFCS